MKIMTQLLEEANPSGPVQVNDIEITIDRDVCIGASACIPPADKTFTLDDEGKAIVQATASEEDEANIIDAARACPVQAIKVKRGEEQIV